MSDADDQIGGTGGQTGRPPGAQRADRAGQGQAQDRPDGDEEDRVNEASKESFPASDPPSSY